MARFSKHWKNLAAAMLLAPLSVAPVGAYVLNTDYRNYWFAPSPAGGIYSNYFGYWPAVGLTNASTPLFQGHALGNTTNVAPTDGRRTLPWSAFGQPVDSQISDYPMGSVIPAPPGADTNRPPANFVARQAGNNLAAYYECTAPAGSAFWVPSTRQVIAAQPNNVEIQWHMTNGTTYLQVLTVDAVPAKRPVRLYWTESPYDAPVVNLAGLFPVLHYNSEVPPPVYNVVTNISGGSTNVTSNVVAGVWLDAQKQLRGLDVEGRLILEYYQEGTYGEQVRPVGIEVVEVLKPRVLNVKADVGSRLLPQDSFWRSVDGDTNIYPYVKVGLNDTVFVFDRDGPKKNWAYAIKKTVDKAWSLQIYWQNRALMDVYWPFEVDWYTCDWPESPQLYVISAATQHQAGVLIPGGLNAELMPFMEPPLQASLPSGGHTFTAQQPGYCLLKYTSADNVWFDAVRSVLHTNTDLFDLSPMAWEIGRELPAPDIRAGAMRFDGQDDFVAIGTSWFESRPAWSLGFWFKSADLAPGTLYGESDGGAGYTFGVALTGTGRLQFSLYNSAHAGANWVNLYSTNYAVSSNQWHYLTAAYAGGSDTGGTLAVWLDNQLLIQTAGCHMVRGVNRGDLWRATISALPRNSDDTWNHFAGTFDQLLIYRAALSQDDLWQSRYWRTFTYRPELLADYSFNERAGSIVHNAIGPKDGTVYGKPVWTYGQIDPTLSVAEYPGYVYTPAGNRYNINRYNYPTEANPDAASRLFAVNTGLLEVWWANRSAHLDMPAVYYPSHVQRYACDWPTHTEPIVIASGLGAAVDLVGATVYYQNLTNQPGYNPNEEHALVINPRVYALRDDLNRAQSSLPFVLLDGLAAGSGQPAMAVYDVLRTNAQYRFEYTGTAGLPILPPMPLAALPLCANTFSLTTPPAWRDRKLGWWACAAGDSGNDTAVADMRFYYQVQSGFWFPALTPTQQPPVGTEVPLLPDSAQGGGTQGAPISMAYTISWPATAPALKIAQTLTKAYHGLPDIWNQLSVEAAYQQSERNGHGQSVTVFDPIVSSGVDLAPAAIDSMKAAKIAQRELTSNKVRFPGLSPSLYPRIYYDPDRGGGQLVLAGQLVEPLVGPGYLLINCLASFERKQALVLADGTDAETAWRTAVNALKGEITVIRPDDLFVKAALYAGLGTGTGYVTVAFNNSTNTARVPAAAPVSLSVLKVTPQLWGGEIEVIEPDDVLDEQLSLRASPDFAGRVDDYQFQWRWAEPVGGLVPNTNYTSWASYGPDTVTGTNEITISGAGPFTLGDHYFALRYRPVITNGPAGTNWSPWVNAFAPGWVQRVMNGINPFQQCYEDKVAHAVDVRAAILEMAGAPYEGDVALNMDAACAGGLVPLYQTVLNRAAAFSILANVNDPSCNQALKYAATRLCDLYMFLGNEAYADAQDPTIAFPRDLDESEHGAEATSIFCFMNMVPTLLEEELALLRGRDDILQPSTQLTPTYNRLIWNFTAGINGGEPAYAYNYNIRGAATSTVGAITAADAKRMYPQGHGDAWGHYLSAMAGYYILLSNTNFAWHTEPGATLMGNATVSTDFCDEQKFAEAAAAKARSGVEIATGVFRKYYTEDPAAVWPGYRDSDTNRAWGVAGWSARTGQATLYDWAVANSLLWDRLTNMTQVGGADQPPEGIQKIDRTTVPELAELASAHKSIQTRLDQADGGLNPLGLARDAVPFDISPTAIDAGQTHFEQVYDRALRALYNACIAFDHARGATLRIREQYDSAGNLETQLAENETDFHNRLVSLYGYPYADDIGPAGSYPEGYAGPDIYNWQILDLENLLVNAPTGQAMQVQVYNLGFLPANNWTGNKYSDYSNLRQTAIASNDVGTMTIYMAANGLKVKPPSWTGRRRAQGELQRALMDYVRQWYALEAQIDEYNQALYGIQVDLLHRQSDYGRYVDEWQAFAADYANRIATSHAVEGLEVARNVSEATADAALQIAVSVGNAVPGTAGGSFGPLPAALVMANPGKIALVAAFSAWGIQLASKAALENGAIGRQALQDRWTANFNNLVGANQYYDLLRWRTMDSLVALREQYIQQADLQQAVAALAQAYERIGQLIAEGDRLMAERGQVRARASQRIQMNRYGDLVLRVYRDDALRRYGETFDLAARYVYMAAKAYDYETGLLASDTRLTPGSRFIESVVRARAPGRFDAWLSNPQVGGAAGEPGLADIMARMKADWDVVKSRFGFNNPETETSRFSLRSESFRISPLAAGDYTWVQTLARYRVDDLRAQPDYVRRCIPFSDGTNAEPALVIPFSTMIVAGRNFFGHDLAGGDSAYDPSRQATKIRAAGVSFVNFNITFNTNSTGGGLANEPRVYLVPVGHDVMRSPTREGLELRDWSVFDQAMPLPYDVGGMDIDSPDWLPVVNALAEPLALERRHAAMRAYHDRGQFTSAEMCSNGRLVGRSVWNTRWLLIIPGRLLLADPDLALDRFIYGPDRNGQGIKDIKVTLQTYSIQGE